MTEATNVLVLGTADWEQPIATNQHYVVVELCKDPNARVTFVESLGLRRPQPTRRDLARILGRLRRLFSRSQGVTVRRPTPPGMRVVSPFVIPYHGWPTRAVNRWLLHRQVREWVTGPSPKVLWTYTPLTYGLEALADRTIYHCVDLLGKFPGIDEAVIDAAESHLALKGVPAAATSRVVADHLRERGFADIRLWENVADVETLQQCDPLGVERVALRVVFAGNLSTNKVDFMLLAKLARAGLDVEIAGPIAEGGGADEASLADLEAAGVRHVGMMDLPSLGRWMSGASAGLIPYLANDYTRGVSPLKTFEYLAVGLPVVSIGVPSVREILGHVEVEATADDFVRQVIAFASKPPSASQVRARMTIASDHSWSGRGKQVRLAAGLQPVISPASHGEPM